MHAKNILTVILILSPRWFNSCLNVSVSAVTAYFDAGYTFAFSKCGTLWPATLLIWTMWPSILLAFIIFTASLVAIHRPKTLVSKIFFHFSVSPSVRFVFWRIPALLMRMLTGPRLSVTHLKPLRMSSSLEMSTLTAWTFPFLPLSFLASSSTRSERRAKPAT